VRLGQLYAFRCYWHRWLLLVRLPESSCVYGYGALLFCSLLYHACSTILLVMHSAALPAACGLPFLARYLYVCTLPLRCSSPFRDVSVCRRRPFPGRWNADIAAWFILPAQGWRRAAAVIFNTADGSDAGRQRTPTRVLVRTPRAWANTSPYHTSPPNGSVLWFV